MYIVNCFPQSTILFYKGNVTSSDTVLTKIRTTTETYFRANTTIGVVSGNVQIRPSSMAANTVNGNVAIASADSMVYTYMDGGPGGLTSRTYLTLFLYNAAGSTLAPSNGMIQRLITMANTNSSSIGTYIEYDTADCNNITISGTTIRYMWNIGTATGRPAPWSVDNLGAPTTQNVTVGLVL